MGNLRWDTALMLTLVFLFLVNVIMAQIKIVNPISQTPTTVFNWFWSGIGDMLFSAFYNVFHAIGGWF